MELPDLESQADVSQLMWMLCDVADVDELRSNARAANTMHPEPSL